MAAAELEAARELERRGLVEAAIKAYIAAGAPEDAARLLTAAGRTAEAGRLLYESLGVAARDLGRLTMSMRTRAMRAAALLGKAGQEDLASELFIGLEQPERALETYVQRGRFTEAAGLARRLGKVRQAGELYTRAALPYEAGICFLEADDPKSALDQLRRVPRDHPRYRMACVKAAGPAQKLGELSFELEQFFAPFLESTPAGESEVAAFSELARLYLDKGAAHDAEAALQKVLAVDPHNIDAAAELGLLEAERGAAGYEALPDLPDAPLLPDLDALQLKKAKPAAARAAGEGPAFVTGAIIADRYRLEQRIGAGGMAVVFRAADLDLGEQIALKVFTQAVQDDQAEERFKRELRLSRQLSNPHIVRLFDIGSFRSIRYISMELLKGQDLRARMGSPLRAAQALDYLIQACAGLQAAHDAGVVHRDFKPENVFVTESGLVKVMDFGIAKVQAAPGLTTTGIIAGTPAYISPEQVSSFSDVSFSSDMYSLGVVAYEIFTGRLPFTHPEPMKLLMMHINDTPAPPRSHVSGIPEELDTLILRLLKKDPAQRFASCRELAAELELIRSRLPRV